MTQRTFRRQWCIARNVELVLMTRSGSQWSGMQKRMEGVGIRSETYAWSREFPLELSCILHSAASSTSWRCIWMLEAKRVASHVFYNTCLGLKRTKGLGDSAEEHDLIERVEEYPAEVPSECEDSDSRCRYSTK